MKSIVARFKVAEKHSRSLLSEVFLPGGVNLKPLGEFCGEKLQNDPACEWNTHPTTRTTGISIKIIKTGSDKKRKRHERSSVYTIATISADFWIIRTDCQ